MNWGVLTEREKGGWGWGQGQNYIGLLFKYIIQASFNFSSEAEKQLMDAPGDGSLKHGKVGGDIIGERCPIPAARDHIHTKAESIVGKTMTGRRQDRAANMMGEQQEAVVPGRK